MSEIVAVGR